MNIIFNPDDTLLYGCSLNGDVAEISIEECKNSFNKARKLELAHEEELSLKVSQILNISNLVY